MCGIFGFVRCQRAPDPALASMAFVALGHLAQERGRDASGVALVGGRHQAPASRAGRGIRYRRLTIDDCLVVKSGAPFTRLWYDDGSLVRPLDRATVALGHCRWATRGAAHAIVNASPMVVDRLIGTHNGDIDEGELARRCQLDLGEMIGSTDTEVLFSALASVPSRAKPITSVLEKVSGRAALAWVDRDNPTDVHLARTALSPLVTARDRVGNFYWASNPRWFRVLDRKGSFGFRDIVAVREGSYLRVGGRFGLAPWVEGEAAFTAHAREQDLWAARGVWRGFDPVDISYERARATHVVNGRAARVGGPSRSRARRRPARGRGRSADWP
jgi:glucosamine--fructose-6-phosphate aminotransferase (isomerizing)